ncbi:MAG: DNA polymerase II large subunit [Nanoarchaeota archaeon]|nr:DNA polymerase II large subunit [Nanoarchaeota archaeon]
MDKYFAEIDKNVKKLYEVAEQARKKGFDPVDHVEIPEARNMAERVEGLISAIAPQIKNCGIVPRIQELEKEYGTQDWRVALKIALEVAQEKFCKFKDKKEAMEIGIRVGFAYVTVGVVSSPLEGFVELRFHKRKDGKEYFALRYSGPIRSAGGTGASVSVLIADYVRKNMGYAEYDPTEEEAQRTITELADYHERVTNLQYYPSDEEAYYLAKHLPVQIDGDGSEKYEVSNYKDLPRIETNIIRNGFCLVIAECLAQKAPKVFAQIQKWGKEFGMENWNFLEKFLKIQKELKAHKEVKKDDGNSSEEKISPDYTFIKDIVAGRPVITHPLRTGGFRLRYGRGRNTGLSANGLHPATMRVLDDFIATGTQLKTERPGKGTTTYTCDTIEGPIIKLKNGNVIFLDSEEDAIKYRKDIEEILFLGDMLINYGDFYNRAHKLIPCGYNEEWYKQELKKAGADVSKLDIDNIKLDVAVNLSKKYDIPLHPRWTYHWKDITKKQLISLLEWVKKAVIEKNKIILPIDYDLEKDVENADPKRVLELLGIPHSFVAKEYVVIEKDDAKAFVTTLNLPQKNMDLIIENVKSSPNEDVLKIVNIISDIKIKDKSGTFIGARMGRPEKAKMRKLTGSPQVLFPVGTQGGRMRSFQSALEADKIVSDFPVYKCGKCDKETIYPICEDCYEPTKRIYYCPECKESLETEECPNCKTKNEKDEEIPRKTNSYKRHPIDIHHYFNSALKRLGSRHYPDLIKGVRGTSNRDHTPENLIKGILRAIHKLYVNKEGTIRYDMTESPLTAFKPKEIRTSIEKLKELGYTYDIHGKPLENKDQILELKVQDVVLPSCPESPEEGADKVLFRITKFIDDLLEKLYHIPKFYNLEKPDDLAGHLVTGMSPHTSAAVVARIIGFSETQGFFAHPVYHCLLRRDCDGDEACVMMMLDALINFSRNYLPAHRGATQDAPLVLTSKIIPSEVDDMVFDMEMVSEYPLEFYEAAENYMPSRDFKMDQLKNHLGKPTEYSGYGFTHDTSNINHGVRYSAYKTLPTMAEKVNGQMNLAEKIRAVDEADVGRLVIERHFLRDIKGNLRKFSMQQFRCVGCNEKFRRPPLRGKCNKCNGKIIFTISEGSVIKYLKPSMELAERCSLPPYLIQTLDILKDRIESVFGKDKDRQEGLVKWF